MPTVTATVNMTSQTTAGIRSWAGQVEALLTAAGWVRTADTGQTNAAALPAATSNTFSGYQIWRMNDALQATAPVFVRFDFGCGTGDVASLRIRIGTGSDGTGNLTGALSDSYFGTSTGGSTAASFRGSGDTNRFAMFMGAASAPSTCLSIERSKDLSGADTSDGVMYLHNISASNVFTLRNFTFLRFSANTFTSSSNLGAFCPSGTTWADAGGLFGVCPVRHFNGQPSNPGLSWLVYMGADTSPLVSVLCNMYGTSHSYLPLGTSLLNTVTNGNASSSFAMLWE